jgi:hypothetical protein
MKLESPLIISPRLLPAVKIADCTISLEFHDYSADNRCTLATHYDRPGKKSFTEIALSTGVGEEWNDETVRKSFCALLVFISAAVESREYRERQGKPRDDTADTTENLFPPFLLKYFSDHSSELLEVSIELEEEELSIEPEEEELSIEPKTDSHN